MESERRLRWKQWVPKKPNRTTRKNIKEKENRYTDIPNKEEKNKKEQKYNKYDNDDKIGIYNKNGNSKNEGNDEHKECQMWKTKIKTMKWMIEKAMIKMRSTIQKKIEKEKNEYEESQNHMHHGWTKRK